MNNWIDSLTQQWVIITGRSINYEQNKWILAPVGFNDTIGDSFLEVYIVDPSFRVERNVKKGGLVKSFKDIIPSENDYIKLSKEVVDFYENTSEYEMDVWHKWNSRWKLGYMIVSRIFTRRLQQLNLPIDPLDAAFGLASEIIHVSSKDNNSFFSVWFRKIKRTNRVIYSGTYEPITLPNEKVTCLRVAFPLPNGNAQVFLRPSVTAAGGLLLVSRGKKFGDSGFYFAVKRNGDNFSMNYIKGMHESINVYLHSDGELRADHVLNLWGFKFLHLHYRMRKKMDVAYHDNH